MEMTEKMKKAFEHIDPDTVKYGVSIPMVGIAMRLQIEELNRQRRQQLAKSYEDTKAAFERYKETVFKKQHPIKHFFRELFKKLKGRA